MVYNITINTDDNYIQHAMAMLCSLYENNKQHKMHLHVLQNKMSDASKELIRSLSGKYGHEVDFYNVDHSKLEGVQFRKNRPLSMAAYYRLLFCSVLPSDIEKVLYLDCDIIVVKDISEIFELEIDNYALAACLDTIPYTSQHRLQMHMEVDERTFCSGVMLVNLQYWRDHNVEPGLLEYAKRHRKEVWLHDQDVLNYYFKKQWFLLPPKWNRIANLLRALDYPYYKDFDRREYLVDPMLYHYADMSMKPWHDAPSPCRNYYLEYLRKSGFKDVKFKEISLFGKVKWTIKTLKYNCLCFLYKTIHAY